MKKIIIAILILMILISLGLLFFLILGNPKPRDIVYEDHWENSAYYKIRDSLDEQKSFKIIIPENFFISQDRMVEIAQEAYLNSPKVIAFTGYSYLSGIIKYEYDMDYIERKNKAKRVQDEIDLALDEIIPNASTYYDKIILAHDYLIDHIEYDTDLDFQLDLNGNYNSAHDSYGAMVEGVAVCDGYAKAYKMLLDELGVNSILVYGEGEGIPHAWNMVEINNEFYHVDTTWNDQEAMPVHFYFLATDEIMEKKHIWSDKYPKATSTKENYFFRNSLVCKDSEKLKLLIESNLLKGESSMEFLLWEFPHNEAAVKSWVSEAVRNSGMRIGQYTYVYDEDLDFLLLMMGEVYEKAI